MAPKKPSHVVQVHREDRPEHDRGHAEHREAGTGTEDQTDGAGRLAEDDQEGKGHRMCIVSVVPEYRGIRANPTAA